MFLLTALTLGFLGSFHCVGMCGPIALAIPVRRNSGLSIIGGSLLYNTGRIVSYSLMGLTFGMFGQGIAMAGWQGWLSVLIGVLLLLNLILPRIIRIRVGIVYRLLEPLKSKVRQLFGVKTSFSLFMIGLLNGFLPCGLVYLGIAGAVATGNSIQGMLFMAAFGLGTLPAMMTLTIIRDSISVRFRERIRAVVPVFIGGMAVMLILRGMNLGIPYISPSIEETNGNCHHKCCSK
ncbi:MAG: sulfite exporter TauE/SafE family protein [Bacteroidota bacterium]